MPQDDVGLIERNVSKLTFKTLCVCRSFYLQLLGQLGYEAIAASLANVVGSCIHALLYGPLVFCALHLIFPGKMSLLQCWALSSLVLMSTRSFNTLVIVAEEDEEKEQP